MLDSTVIRAHMQLRIKNGPQSEQALGRSRGGFSTVSPSARRCAWQTASFLLTGGQRHDITQADALIAPFDFDRIIADRGYDSDDFRVKRLPPVALTLWFLLEKAAFNHERMTTISIKNVT
ncbi:MAG: hypothetical protein R2932_44900 [Caldilineaceae bacterium]